MLRMACSSSNTSSGAFDNDRSNLLSDRDRNNDSSYTSANEYGSGDRDTLGEGRFDSSNNTGSRNQTDTVAGGLDSFDRNQ